MRSYCYIIMKVEPAAAVARDFPPITLEFLRIELLFINHLHNHYCEVCRGSCEYPVASMQHRHMHAHTHTKPVAVVTLPRLLHMASVLQEDMAHE